MDSLRDHDTKLAEYVNILNGINAPTYYAHSADEQLHLLPDSSQYKMCKYEHCGYMVAFTTETEQKRFRTKMNAHYEAVHGDK